MTEQALHIRQAVHVLHTDVVLAAFQLALDLPHFEAEANTVVREASHAISTLKQRLDEVETSKMRPMERSIELRAISDHAQPKSLELLGNLQAHRALG